MKIATIISIVIFLSVLASGVVLLNNQRVSNQEENINWTSKLPDKPSDFYSWKRDIETGAITDLCKIEKEYYIQPDFSPVWDRARERYYVNHDYSRWVVHGYGSYPGTIGYSLSNLSEGDEINLCTFFKSAYGLETWQGIKLQPIENEYFNLEITPNLFISEPTFPKFEENWTRKINIKLKVKEKPPKGTYRLGFKVVKPNQDWNNKKIWEVLTKDTDKSADYAKNCIQKLKSNTANQECEDWFNRRQKKYVPGGGYQTELNTFTLILKIE